KSINDLDSGEQASLDSAANSLALSGGNLLAREIGGRLGFDEVGVAAGSEPGSASLVIGKYLNPRLFVSYGVGLFDAVNEVRVRYRLGSQWTVEAASGEQSSADLVYTIER
ncbi:MAG: translocation/assembly module TamB domain-containing protein, partial [Gammaproteobacteria bacterium]|nr:translocation/assembly module TamB domain-containing protein [Gammaproteobacteria bacterium]